MTLWAAKWRSQNKLDGKREYLIVYQWRTRKPELLFRTRVECRAWIEQEYGYIRKRPDLRAEPHGWKMPVAVKVEIKEADNGDHRTGRTVGRAD